MIPPAANPTTAPAAPTATGFTPTVGFGNVLGNRDAELPVLLGRCGRETPPKLLSASLGAFGLVDVDVDAGRRCLSSVPSDGFWYPGWYRFDFLCSALCLQRSFRCLVKCSVCCGFTTSSTANILGLPCSVTGGMNGTG